MTKYLIFDHIVTDNRFASIATDPKFMTAPKSVTKVKVDKRFKKMVQDKDFMTGAVKDKLGMSIYDSLRYEYLFYNKI